MNSRQKQHCSGRSLGISPVAPFGEVRAIGDDGNGLAQSKLAKILRFLFGGCHQEHRRCQIPPLIEQEGQPFLPASIGQGPRLQHAARLDDEGNTRAAGQSRRPVVYRRPKSMAV